MQQIMTLKKELMILMAMLFVFGLTTSVDAQATKPTAKTEILKPVVFLVKFGPYKNNMQIVLTDIKRAVNTELKVTDSASGLAYQVISFRFGWRKKEPSDDYKTGKKKIITSFNAVDVYNNTRIPEAWQLELTESAKSTDEFLFEAIYVQHPTTKKMYQVPSISLKVI